MEMPAFGPVSRRFAVGAIGVSALAVAFSRQTLQRAITQRGMVGGGLAKFDSSEAQFSLTTSRLSFADGTPDAIVGSIVWVDAPSGDAFASTAITDYEVIESQSEQGEVRRIRGMMRRNDEREYPFSLNVTDAGPPGSGLDSVALIVGDGADLGPGATPVSGLGYSYAAAGPITVGDVHDVDFDIGGGAEGGTPTPAG